LFTPGASPLHARAHYVGADGRTHTLELWRSASTIRRTTDDRVTLVAERPAHGEERYQIIDLPRKRAYHATRTNLYRIGTFPDFDTLATMLPRPMAKIDPLHKREQTPFGPCDWYAAKVDGASGPVTTLCWSK